jgi:hypothetical protein
MSWSVPRARKWCTSSSARLLLKNEMSWHSSLANVSASSSSVRVAMMPATMEPTDEPASTRGSIRASNSALTTPWGRGGKGANGEGGGCKSTGRWETGTPGCGTGEKASASGVQGQGTGARGVTHNVEAAEAAAPAEQERSAAVCVAHLPGVRGGGGEHRRRVHRWQVRGWCCWAFSVDQTQAAYAAQHGQQWASPEESQFLLGAHARLRPVRQC